MIGPPTQDGYAAAHAFFDALAAHRRGRSLPALTVNWGAVSKVGYVARHPELWDVSARVGVEAITPDEAFAALETALRGGATRVAIGRIDWTPWAAAGRPDREGGAAAPREGSGDEHAAARGSSGVDLSGLPPGERAAVAEAHVVRRAATVLDTGPDRVDPAAVLTDLGLDSLMVVELQTMLQRDFGVEIPLVDVLDDSSVRDLARRVVPQSADAEALAP